MADIETKSNQVEEGGGASQRPKRLEKVCNAVIPALQEQFGEDAFSFVEYRDELSVSLPSDELLNAAQYLRDTEGLKFDMLRDVHVVDWNRRKDRFELIYNLYSLGNALRLRVKCFTQEKEPHVDSLAELYPSANWYEREAYDMHGIIFDGHPDLRRMYMPEDFVDPETGDPLYPLRKEFPMMGVPNSLPLPERGEPGHS